MKRVLLLTMVALLSIGSFGQAKTKANKDTQNYRYEIECAGNGATGTYLVKVSTYSKKQAVAAEWTIKNAIHGVIFKGYGGGDGCVAQKPLVRDAGAETENAEYFKQFFANGGEFQKYASVVSGTMETTKVGKEYKVTQTVSVRKDDLRKALEAAGVVRGLGSIF